MPKRRLQYNKISSFENRLYFILSFLMAFPVVLIGPLNASLFIFSLLLFKSFNHGFSLKLNTLTQWAALGFAIGAITSVIFIPDIHNPLAFSKALEVLPNYIYWVLLVMFLIAQRKKIPINLIFKGLTYGVVCTVIYYFLLQGTLSSLPLLKKITPNLLAFILICYSPIAIFTVLKTKSRLLAFTLWGLLILLLLSIGRRAGVGLVFVGGFLVLFSAKINVKNIVFSTSFLALVLFSLSTNLVKNAILGANERIYEIMYSSDEVQRFDRSYLIRIAMVKKGLAIFKIHPFTGIGLNNFTNFETRMQGGFEGAKYVIFKKDMFKDTSAHNSYISLLAEGGLLLLLPYLILLFAIFLTFIKNYQKTPEHTRAVIFSLFAMSLHLYFISAIVNVFTWFLLGLSAALVKIKELR